jgi:hypothetical protein
VRGRCLLTHGGGREVGGTTVTADAMKPLGPKAGDFGWRVRDSEGAVPYREATMSYRSSYGMVQIGADQNQSSTGGLLELRGAITSMAGDVFFSDRIDDALAVVDAGAPGVEVFNENRPIGVTNAKGLLRVPTLRSYQKNKITVDPSRLPVDAERWRKRENWWRLQIAPAFSSPSKCAAILTLPSWCSCAPTAASCRPDRWGGSTEAMSLSSATMGRPSSKT